MVEAVFGEKLADQTYIDRKGVYAIIMNEKNEVATVKLPHGYFLPGGGLEGEESKEACLRRECLEDSDGKLKLMSMFARRLIIIFQFIVTNICTQQVIFI